MDSLYLSLQTKSGTIKKPKSASLKQFQSITKLVITPTSRRNALQKSQVPQTSRASAGKSYENLFKKPKESSSQSSLSAKRTSSNAHSKKSQRDPSSNIPKKPINLSLSSPKPSLVKNPMTPRSSAPPSKPSPRSSNPLNKPLRLISKERVLEKTRKSGGISFETCARTNTGSMNNKPKPNNQDEFFIHHNYAQCTGQVLLGVMDGHGIYGHEVSSFVKRQLPLLIENNLPYEVTSSNKVTPDILSKLQKAFKQGFMNTHKTLVSKRVIDINYSGTTAITVLIRDKYAICANVGDSRAIIGRLNDVWYPVDLSHDHKPNDKLERMRIEEAGGRIEAFKDAGGQFIGPQRVWLQHEQLPGLAMSRSIGDLVAAHVGVISEPDIIVHELTPLDKFIVIASDGVWEFISSHNCVKIISEFYIEQNISKACDALMQESLKMWHKEDNVVDDITFIIIFLNVN